MDSHGTHIVQTQVQSTVQSVHCVIFVQHGFMQPAKGLVRMTTPDLIS